MMKIKKIAIFLLIAVFMFSAESVYMTHAEEVEVEESDEPVIDPGGEDSGGGDTDTSPSSKPKSPKKSNTDDNNNNSGNSNSSSTATNQRTSTYSYTTNTTNTTSNTTTTVAQAKDISDIDVYISAPGIKHYNGSEQKWSPTLKYKTHKLTNGLDYIVSYDTDNFVDAKVIHVTISGTGSYKGTVKVTYEILPKKVTYTAKSATKESGTKDPKFTYTCSSKKDVVKDDLLITRIDGESEGDYTILITGPKVTKDHNYIINYKNATLTIEND